MARSERRLEVTDGRVLAALAHPLRVALLYQLNALGSRTASQCAQALDAAIRPYIGLTRADPPPGAQPVHLDFKAFLRPEALA